MTLPSAGRSRHRRPRVERKRRNQSPATHSSVRGGVRGWVEGDIAILGHPVSGLLLTPCRIESVNAGKHPQQRPEKESDIEKMSAGPRRVPHRASGLRPPSTSSRGPAAGGRRGEKPQPRRRSGARASGSRSRPRAERPRMPAPRVRRSGKGRQSGEPGQEGQPRDQRQAQGNQGMTRRFPPSVAERVRRRPSRPPRRPRSGTRRRTPPLARETPPGSVAAPRPDPARPGAPDKAGPECGRQRGRLGSAPAEVRASTREADPVRHD